MIESLLIVAAYLLGSLSSAIIVCKLAGLPDPRSQGSGNPGATNVLRFASKKLAAVVLLGDMLKGLLPVMLAQLAGTGATTASAAGLAAFLGHLYPVFFGFRGGKGVATALGVILGLSWLAGLAVLLVWLLLALTFRISSLAAIGAGLSAPLIIWWLRPVPAVTFITTVLAILLLWRHRANIHNLISGREPRIGKK